MKVRYGQPSNEIYPPHLPPVDTGSCFNYDVNTQPPSLKVDWDSNVVQLRYAY